MTDEMNKSFENFKIDVGKEEKDEHQEILGSENERIPSNVEKVTTFLGMHSVTFDRVDNVFIILTKKVMSIKILNDAKTIGQPKHDKFAKGKQTREESIWNIMTKEKISTFSANNKAIKVTLERQIVHIREKQKLMTRLLITSRSCPGTDLKKYLGICEYPVEQ